MTSALFFEYSLDHFFFSPLFWPDFNLYKQCLIRWAHTVCYGGFQSTTADDKADDNLVAIGCKSVLMYFLKAYKIVKLVIYHISNNNVG